MLTPMHLAIDHRGAWPVVSFEEASAIYTRERSRTGLGASSWPDGWIMVDNLPISRVSYNGRVWRPGPWTPGDVPITEACAPAELVQLEDEL